MVLIIVLVSFQGLGLDFIDSFEEFSICYIFHIGSL